MNNVENQPLMNNQDMLDDHNRVNELSRSLYALGSAIKAGENQSHIAQLLTALQTSLDDFVQTPRMQYLKLTFNLNPLELKLVALAFVNTLEPETLAPFLGLSWFDHGATLSLERALLLIQKSAGEDNQQDKVSSLDTLFSNMKVFRWQILSLSETALPLIQPLTLAPDIFAYLLANRQSIDNAPALIRTLASQHDSVIALCFDKLLKQPLAQVNVLTGLDSDERSALVAQFSASAALPWHYLPLNGSADFSTGTILRTFRQILLSANGEASYVYWPKLLGFIVEHSDSSTLLPLLLSADNLVLFCDQQTGETEQSSHQAQGVAANHHRWLEDKLVENCLLPLTPIPTLSLLSSSSQKVQPLSLMLTAPEPEQSAAAWLALSSALMADITAKNQLEYQPIVQALTSEQANYLANLYPLYPSVMSRVGGNVAGVLAKSQDSESLFQLLQNACLQANSEITGQLASLSQPRYQLHDMILADNIREQLQELIDRLSYRSQLSQALSHFTPGIQALFWGKPGTGKSMAAEAIAGQLKLPLYKVNLANVASKWIGESEKHLAKLFDDAQKQNAVLLFDEADAIFAKRSEVESSQDKNANMGVSYLLQRMETYTGLLLLSTNFKSNLDDAFLRRFHGVVEFTLPDEKLRFQLWQRAWSSSMSIASGINLLTLAKEFEFTPSQIKNIAERALLYSLKAQQKTITKALLGKAILRELEKQNASFLAEQQLNSWLAMN